MADVSELLSELEKQPNNSTDELLVAVYKELKRLAAKKLKQEFGESTLQPTALVHEAYLRLVTSPESLSWNSRGHFFAAAAEAMRRILVDRARSRNSQKRGGGERPAQLNEDLHIPANKNRQLLAVDEAVEELQKHDEIAAQLVKLRYFAGLGQADAAEMLGLSRRTADRTWATARAWLFSYIHPEN